MRPRPLAALIGWWFAPAPAQRLAAVRILVGSFALIYLAIRLPHLLGCTGFPARDFAPIGVVALAPGPLPGWLVVGLALATVVFAVPFALGWRYRMTAPLFAALALWVLSYRNSWGMIFHTENLLVLHVAVLACAPAAAAWSLDARARPAAPDHERFGWPLRLLAAVTVATYLLAGLAKLRFGGLGWVTGQVLRDTIAADNLRKLLLGSPDSPLAPALLGHTWLFALLSLGSLVVELGAPLALVHRRLAAIWSVAAIGFHLGVLALMAILFPYPTAGVAFSPLLRAERPVGWLLARVRSCRARRATAPPAAP